MTNTIPGQLSLFDNHKTLKEILGPNGYYKFVHDLQYLVFEHTVHSHEIDEEKESTLYLRKNAPQYLAEDYSSVRETGYMYLSIPDMHSRYEKDKLKTKFKYVYQKLKEEKNMLDVTDAKIAKRSGIARSTLNQYQSGKRHPTREHILSLSFTLGLTLKETEVFMATQGYVFVTETDSLCMQMLAQEDHRFLLLT